MESVLRLPPQQRAELFRAAAQKLGFSEVVVEKDFWVCWTLQQLFALPEIGEHLIFKGGTSLSKVWRAITRFSEDIDVSLSRDWLGFAGERDPEHASTGAKKRARLDELARACASRIRTEVLPALHQHVVATLGAGGWRLAVDAQDEQTMRFTYPTALGEHEPAAYIRREVRIECGARSDAWPAEEKTILPYVAEAYPDTIRDAAVRLKVLSIERTFWEKATILHAEAHRAEDKATPTRFSRHYADLAALADHAGGRAALRRDDLRARVVKHKQVFFPAAWAHYETAVSGSFRLMPSESRLLALAADYRAMEEMFFGDIRPWREIVSRLRALEQTINARPTTAEP